MPTLDDANIQAVCEKIRKRCGSRVSCHVLRDEPWRIRGAVLVALGFDRAADVEWFEVSREDAEALTALALARDLCYGQRVMAPDTARRLVAEFLALFHPQTRYFTNSEIPYHKRAPNSWSFGELRNDLTIETGIVCKTGKELSGILIVGDID